MSGTLIYLFPALMDLVLSGVIFMSTVWAAQRGTSASNVANLLTVWAGVYMLVSLLAGRVVTRQNVGWLLIGACLATAALAAAFAVCSSLAGMYALMALQGIAMAAFFTPFQVFMKLVGEGKRRPITHSAGLYTFSWSAGFACGPFVSGFLWTQIGWEGCHAVNALVALAIAVGVYLLKHHADVAPRAPEAGPKDGSARGGPRTDRLAAENGGADYTGMPDLAWMGWVFSGIGCMTVIMIRGIFPSSGAAYHISKIDQGLVFFILSATQALTGLALCRSRWWMYRPTPVFVFGLFGAAGLCLFSAAQTSAAFYWAAACFGVYSGAFCFYLVFHSLVHHDKSARYISINEAVVGLTGIAGPFLGGLIADVYELSTSYLLAAGMVALAVTVQTRLHLRSASHHRFRWPPDG